ncbi:MAG: hypothetical protein QOF79_99 [Actinomycetota bacterium]|nr:hypothetical protein [Actinomycetota bacterium]
MTNAESTLLSFRARPIAHLLGALGSWFLYSLNFTLFVYSVTAVVAVGGTCASGNTAYIIAVQCPRNADAFLPWCIFAALFAIAVAIYLGQGFGTQLIMIAWPVLFCGLGAIFLAEFFATGDPTGLAIGGLFEVMGLIPLIIELRGSVQRVFLGSINIRGERFYEGPRARRSMMSPSTPNPEGAVSPTAADWLLSIAITIVGIVGGVVLAYLWFRTV